MKQPIFLLGSHKSGSSLLRALLDGHDNFFVFPRETHFFQYANFWVDYSLRRNLPVKSYSAKKSFLEYIDEQNRNNDPFSDNNQFEGYKIDRFISCFNESENSNLKSLMENYWQSLCFAITGNQNMHKRRFVEKSVENAEFACLLRHFFPDCKFIHIVRNPYATLTAIRKMKSKDGFPFIGNIVQSMINSYYYLFKNSSYMKNYKIIKYEELLSNSELVMKDICDFLNINYSNQLLTPSCLGNIWYGNSTSKEKFSKISSKPISAWESTITPMEIKIVNSFFSHVLERYDYKKIRNNRMDWLLKNRNEHPKIYIKNRLFLKTFT